MHTTTFPPPRLLQQCPPSNTNNSCNNTLIQSIRLVSSPTKCIHRDRHRRARVRAVTTLCSNTMQDNSNHRVTDPVQQDMNGMLTRRGTQVPFLLLLPHLRDHLWEEVRYPVRCTESPFLWQWVRGQCHPFSLQHRCRTLLKRHHPLTEVRHPVTWQSVTLATVLNP